MNKNNLFDLFFDYFRKFFLFRFCDISKIIGNDDDATAMRFIDG